MKIECMKNLIYTFVGSATLVLLTSCSAEFENGTPEPWQREINPNENYEYTIKHPCLVNTEAGSDNDWIPLQQQWKRCTALLEDFASGKQKLPLPEANPDREDASVAVVSPPPFFDFRGF